MDPWRCRYVSRTLPPAGRVTEGTRIQLCGRLSVEIAGVQLAQALRGKQVRLLLAYLALNRSRHVGRAELIDVLWLDRNAIVAAFEIESTTSIYSGLLRMADLVAMQPNLNIPLFLVAPEERREKVFTKVNRPTFSRLDPRLAEICRYISFDALRERLAQVKDFVRYLKPDFLEDLSEACELDQE